MIILLSIICQFTDRFLNCSSWRLWCQWRDPETGKIFVTASNHVGDTGCSCSLLICNKNC